MITIRLAASRQTLRAVHKPTKLIRARKGRGSYSRKGAN